MQQALISERWEMAQAIVAQSLGFERPAERGGQGAQLIVVAGSIAKEDPYPRILFRRRWNCHR
jgi:hypothetical protein